MKIGYFDKPREERYFEDYEAGITYELGSFSLTETDIVTFAERFDPQPFHIDRDAAAAGPYGGIIASGWHTGSATMRLMVDEYISSVAGLGSPGVDQIRWTHPVRPNDRLSVRITVTGARRSRSKPERGIVQSEIVVTNQNEKPVMTMTATGFVLSRTMID